MANLAVCGGIWTFLAGLDGVEMIDLEKFPVHFQGVKPKGNTVKIVGKIDFSDSHPFVKAYQILKDCAGDYQLNSLFHRLVCSTSSPPFVKKTMFRLTFIKTKKNCTNDIANAVQSRQ